MMDLSAMDSASMYAERGLHTIPVWRSSNGVCHCPRGKDCISPGKHPAIDAWQTSATTDLMVIRDWFSANRYNIGVVCGASNVVVIDIDPRNGGAETFASLIAELGPLPATLTADSGGGGTHYVFRRPAGELISKLGQGVDLLRDSRQFLVEPSVHPSGQRYRWRAGCAPDEVTIADMPPSWVARIHQRALPRPTVTRSRDDDRIRRARAYLAKIPGAVSNQSGHTATFNAVAAIMIGFDLSESDTLHLITEDFNPRCDPPWSERELKHKIKSVAKDCQRARGYLLTERSSASSASASAAPCQTAPQVPPAPPVDWTSLLLYTDKQKARRAYHNTAVFVRHHPSYRGKWSYDEMTGSPWFASAPMRPEIVHRIRADADCHLGYTPPATDVEAAIIEAAKDRPFHPIRQYLRSVDWDGEPRLSSMARDYLGSNDRLHSEMVRKFMIGAAARALWPGCKLDTALMLVGEQGNLKSTFFAVLGGQWHADTFIDITSKDAGLQLHSAWIYELAELENVVTGRAESRLKAWLTSTHDLYRPPYGRVAERRARACAMCGTTNRQQFLTDDTGSRRFWIITVRQKVPRDLLVSMRDQLWAEAICAAESGESWWFEAAAETDRETANQQHQEDDSWIDPVHRWLGANRAASEVTLTEVMEGALDLEVGKHDRWSQMRVAKILKALQWARVRLGTVPRTWVYRRPDTLPGVV